MFDLALLQGAVTGLDTAAKMAKGFLELRSMAEVQGKVIELQSVILSAQSSAFAAQSQQSTMIQRIRELEEEIARVKAWETEKQRYKLVEVHPGSLALSLKEESKGTEPPHLICAKCYEDGKKSILQHNGKLTYHDSRMRCPTCNNEVLRQSHEPSEALTIASKI